MKSIFISHSHQDRIFVEALEKLLIYGLPALTGDDVRASSIEELQLSGGAPIDESIRKEIAEARVVIAVLSPSSVESAWVQWELGARWGYNKIFIPLLVPGMSRDAIRGPLRGYQLYESTETQLYGLLETTADELRNIESDATEEFIEISERFNNLRPQKAMHLKEDIKNVVTAKTGMEVLRFATLSYVVDLAFNFALLRDDFYKKIQPPGRKLKRHERPDRVARSAVVSETGLPTEELKNVPPFLERHYSDTSVVRPPYQVQLERNAQRTALAHYDFVYIFGINRHSPELRLDLPSGEHEYHKQDPAWYSFDDVKKRLDADYGPHADMIPTMTRILEDFRDAVPFEDPPVDV